MDHNFLSEQDSNDDQFSSQHLDQSSKLGDEQDSSSDNDGSSDDDQNEQSSIDEDTDQNTQILSAEQQLQRQILKTALSQQKKRKPFITNIMQDIVDKIKKYEEVSNDQSGEQLVTLRIQELVYTKILVLSYGCSSLRLVLAHYKLGKAYLSHDCPEQAIEHLSVAVLKNQKLFDSIERTEQFHCIMLNVLGQCFMKKQDYDDAIDALGRSIRISDQLLTGESSSVNKAKILLAQCHCKHREYDNAIGIIDKVLQSISAKKQSEQTYAFALVEKANILAIQGNYQSAVIQQQQAINILIDINYEKPEDVAELYSQLADYYDKIGSPQNSLSCLQKLKTLYQQYSGEEKCVIKARRRIATSLLKSERFKQAVNQLLQIIEMEEKVFGESSLQLARSYKLLGVVYISLEIGSAKLHLKKSMNLFSLHGQRRQVEEIKQKLNALAGTHDEHIQLKNYSEQDI